MVYGSSLVTREIILRLDQYLNGDSIPSFSMLYGSSLVARETILRLNQYLDGEP
jgi:hypothetical protein